MIKSGTTAAYSGTRNFQLVESVLLIAGSVLVQFAVHFVPPVNGVPLGQILLPAFIAPLIALIYFRFNTALITAAFAPVINYLITGAPAAGIVGTLTIEAVLFTAAAGLLLRLNNTKYAAALIAFIAARVVTGIFTGLALTSFYVAIPGLIFLVLLNIVLLKKK